MTPPATGDPLESRSVALSAVGNALLMTVAWGLPAVAVRLLVVPLPRMRTFVGAAGGVVDVCCAGSTNSVIVCAGSVAVNVVPLRLVSARRVMLLVELRRQTCTGFCTV